MIFEFDLHGKHVLVFSQWRVIITIQALNCLDSMGGSLQVMKRSTMATQVFMRFLGEDIMA